MATAFKDFLNGLSPWTDTQPTADYIYVYRAGVEKKMKLSTARQLPSIDEPSVTNVDLTGDVEHEVTLTGTTDIESITVPEGSHIWLTFDDVLTLVYDATDFPIYGDADIVTEAGGRALLVGGPSDIGFIKQYIRPIGPDKLGTGVAQAISDAGTIAIGDAEDTTNVTKIVIDDGAHSILLTSNDNAAAFGATFQILGIAHTASISAATLRLDSRDGAAGLGDLGGVGNGTKLTLTDSTETIAIIAAGGVSCTGPVNDTRPVVAKVDTASPYAIDAAETGTIFTNEGTAGDVVFELPASAGCTAGKTRFTFVNLSGGSYRNFIKPDGTDHLYFRSGATSFDAVSGSPALDNKESGATMTVLYIGGGIWITEGAPTDAWTV